MTEAGSIEFGFVTNCLGRTTLDDAIHVAQETGLTCLEVGPSIKRDLPAFRRIVQQGEIRLHSFIYGRNFLTLDPALRNEYARELRRLLDLALLLDVPQITMSTGVRSDLTLDENIESAMEYWRPIFEEGAAGGLRFALEFCPVAGNFALGPASWRPLFRHTSVYTNFGLNYDPSHLLWQMIDPYAPVPEFSDRIFSVHAKDTHVQCNLLAEHGMVTPYRYTEVAPHGVVEARAPWWEFRIPGEGDMNWQRFFGLLLNVGYHGAVMIELEAHNYQGSRKRVMAGLVRSLEHLRGALDAAQQEKQRQN